MHPRGKIVQSYRENNQLVLYIDKGSAAGVKAGMTGNILLGPDGDITLDGGSLRVTRVVDQTKCVASSSIGKVGKNNRCVVHLVK